MNLFLALLPLLVQYDAIGVPDSAPRKAFPERRVYVQSQAWWEPKGGHPEHIHVEAAVPIGQTVSGTLSFDVRVQLHDQPPGSEVNLLRVIDERGVRLVEQKVSIKPDAHGHADVWIKDVRIDTRKQRNGRREYRFTANMSTRADGKRQYQSTGWCWYVSNALGGAGSHYRSDKFHEARGWYTAANYANARLESLFPFEPVTGQWAVKVALVAGSGGKPVTAHMVTIDPDFHGGNAGTVIKQGSGPYRGGVTIDTTKLAKGPHKLVLITHQDISTGRNSGVLVVPFVVK